MELLDLVGGKRQRTVLGAGFRHALMSAFIVTLYDVGFDVLGAPGSRLGTINRRDKHLNDRVCSKTLSLFEARRFALGRHVHSLRIAEDISSPIL
jgi:hypothetical protein